MGSGNYSGNVLVVADTANLRYGNNLNYVDSVFMANEIYPTKFLTKPQPTDMPLPSSFLPAGYKPGDGYEGASVLHKNNPLFVAFPLPTTTRLRDINTQSSYNFRVQAGSPVLGKGTTSFQPLAATPAIPVSANFGATAITPPNKDLGAYPSDNSGNQH